MIDYLNIVGGESDNLLHGGEGFHVPAEAVRRRLDAFARSGNSIVMIAVSDDEIVARAEIEGYGAERIRHNGKLSVSVRKQFWNRKIGTRLLETILERADEMGLKNISLEVVADNVPAIALYHKLGFTDMGIYRNFWYVNGVYKDAIMMRKDVGR
ncbi:MAG: GNAT family N-acetyltransferase [Blautia sp.]|nr:GNAT family N-acetyltransferase [Blautia sp.]